MNRQLFVFVLALGLLTTGLATTGIAQAKVTSRTEAYYHFSKARMLDDGGQAAQAIEEYKKALDLDPNNSLILSEMAESYLRNNRLREAVDVAQKAIQGDRDNIEAHKTLGEAYSDLQEYAKAADAYKRAGELDPDNVEIKKAVAQALFLANDFDNAAKKYEDLVKTEPEDGVARLRLGQIYRQQMKYDLARQNLEKASQAFPDSIEIQFNLVLLDRDEGRLEDALKLANDLLKKTEKANGRYTEAEKQNRRVFLINQAILNQTLGNYNEAVRTFTEVKSLTNEKDGRVDALIVETYRLGKNLDRALQHTDQALLETPGSRQLRMLRADLVAEKGRVDEGIKALQQLQKGNDEDLDVLSAMVSVYQRAKRFDDAQNVLNRAIQRFPNEEQVHFLQGSVYEKQKKYSDAEKAFRKALEIQKDDPAVLNYLGFMFADRGIRLHEAEAMIQKAVQADPTNGAYLDSLGWVYFKQNRLDRAEEYLKKAIIFLNSESNIHDHLGDVYFKTKRYEEARAEWNKTLQLSTEPEEIDRVKKKLDELKTTKAAQK